ncbi:MAG: Wzz/FepE/Etk N-terminal domain-containing protein, partial [Planctomycetota bacterium]|nr:Wzz/FepE/Etk N-terminal domain-containing protein [Planctomycetota bacterium]
MDQLLIVRDFARTLMRRFFLFTVIVLVGTAASIFYALSLDRVYESVAVVQIQGPQIATETSTETSGMSTAQRIQQIEQQLRARDSLLEVAEKYDLFDAPGMTAADRVNLMREAVRLDSVAGVQQGYGRSDPSALFITARMGDAEKAALVANEFVSQLLERNLRNRERATAETLAFFRREEERLRREIADLDTRLLDYKHENSGALPEGLEFRRDELVRLNEDRREISRRLLELAREESLLGEDGSGMRGASGAVDPIGMELGRLRIELSRMTVSSPNHPDLPRLRGQIAALEESEDATLTRQAESQRRLIADETGLLNEQLVSITERQAELNDLIQATPGVEQELASYTRQREQMQQQLDAAIQGRAEAEIAQRLQSNRQSERFEVLESA